MNKEIDPYTAADFILDYVVSGPTGK
jgi:hypothetical protein